MSDSDQRDPTKHKGKPPGQAATPPSDATVFRKPESSTRVDPRKAGKPNTTDQPQPNLDQTAARAQQGDTTQFKNVADKTGIEATRIQAGEKNGVRPAPRGGQSPDPTPPQSERSQEGVQVLKNRFVLERVLGVGGMGVVYKAKDRLKVEAQDRDPYVAIKVLSEEFKSHPESFIALQRESRKGQRISHPNVVKVYDFDRDGDIVFMTMEYLQGRPLDQIIRQYSTTGLPQDDVWNIVNGICSALSQAHSENIVHSDFKPGNIFVTDSGMAKIFDFGIARAVANIDRQSGKAQDRTVFDAGSLGALTPAYASYEMLVGKKPDIRDDIYALGCITYEMLTGEHPFNRLPADEALKRKLKPKRITGIKTRQWKAIEKALAFLREDRVATVDEFYKMVLPSHRTSYIALSTVLLVLALGGIVYLIVTNRGAAPPPTQTVQLDEIEFKIKYDIHKKKIERLLADPTFTSSWENDLWEEIKSLTELLGNRPDEWLLSLKNQLYSMYLSKIREMIEKGEFQVAAALIENAYKYSNDNKLLDTEKARLAELIKAQEAKNRIAAQDRQRIEADRREKDQVIQKRNSDFDLALKNVNQQLECKSRLNMRDLDIAIDKLRSLDMGRYKKMENSFIVTLAGCITEIAKANPDRALEAKNNAIRTFGENNILASLNITPRDACDLSLAGLGARGERATCRDKIAGVGPGPSMVVIPGSTSIPAFALGKYEISIKELNQFCQSSKECQKIDAGDDSMPATNIGATVVNAYIKWLSQLTRQKYRLPTKAEWMYAANSNTSSHDPNRNCQLSSRGIQKGGQLVRINAGVQNGWGLINYLGNAREFVYDKDMSLLAVGGSFEDAMEDCTVRSVRNHSGAADAVTGFRVLREIARK